MGISITYPDGFFNDRSNLDGVRSFSSRRESAIFIAAYRWTVHPGKEEQFRAAWVRGTDLIRARYGSLGSRLHRDVTAQGLTSFIGIAEWPDRATWQKAFDAKMVYDEPATRAAFVDAIAAAPREPLLLLELTDDLLDRTG